MAHAMMIRVQSRHTPPPSGCPRGEMFGPLVNPCERTSGNRQTAPDGRSRSAGPVGSCRPSYVGFNPPRVRLASGARRDSVRWTSVVGARPDGGVPPSEGAFKRCFVELNSCDLKILYNPTRTPPTPRATCRRLCACFLSPRGPASESEPNLTTVREAEPGNPLALYPHLWWKRPIVWDTSWSVPLQFRSRSGTRGQSWQASRSRQLSDKYSTTAVYGSGATLTNESYQAVD